MGYRSDVAIVVKAEAVTPTLRNLFIDMQNDWDLSSDSYSFGDDDYVFQHKNHYYCYFTSIKWYTIPTGTKNLDYPNRIHTELLKLPDDVYGYTRTGEEAGDIELYGNYWDFNINIQPATTIIDSLID